MFGGAPVYPSPPATKTGRLQISPHYQNCLALAETEFLLDFLKRGPVFPCHSNHVIRRIRGERWELGHRCHYVCEATWNCKNRSHPFAAGFYPDAKLATGLVFFVHRGREPIDLVSGA